MSIVVSLLGKVGYYRMGDFVVTNVYLSVQEPFGFYLRSTWDNSLLHRIPVEGYPESITLSQAIKQVRSSVCGVVNYRDSKAQWYPADDNGEAFECVSFREDKGSASVILKITESIPWIEIETDNTERDYVACEVCGSMHMASSMHFDSHGNYVCSECASEVSTCDDCGAFLIDGEEAHEVYWYRGGAWGTTHMVCDSCFENYVQCMDCGEWIRPGESSLSSRNADQYVCPRCSDNWFYCSDCGNLFNRYESNEDDEEEYCDSCYSRRVNRIRNYGYKPEPIFHKVDWVAEAQDNGSGYEPIYMGVENEIDNGRDANDCAVDILEGRSDLIYAKHDGSLHCGGFELVTHPCTVGYHKNEFPWEDICRTAVNYGFKSHNTTTCGLHVHVNRTALGNNSDEREATIAKIALLLERFWDTLVVFSRRNTDQLHWCKKLDLCLNSCHTEEAAIKKIARDHSTDHDDRYYALNLTNRNTIEFRLFRGTLKRDTIIATLQLVHNMVDYCRRHTVKETLECKWSDFALYHTCDELENYLRERNIEDTDGIQIKLAEPERIFHVGEMVRIRPDIRVSMDFPEVVAGMTSYAGEEHLVIHAWREEFNSAWHYTLADVPCYYWFGTSLQAAA